MENIKNKNQFHKISMIIMILIVFVLGLMCSFACVDSDEAIIYKSYVLQLDRFSSSGVYEGELQITLENMSGSELEDIYITVNFSADSDFSRFVYIDQMDAYEEATYILTFYSSYSNIEVESFECEIDGNVSYTMLSSEEYDAVEPTSESEGFNGGIFLVIVGLIAVVFVVVKKLVDKTKENSNTGGLGTKNSDYYATLKHEDCEVNVGDSCLHDDMITQVDARARKRCGYNNVKNAKRCSVCGTKLKWW